MMREERAASPGGFDHPHDFGRGLARWQAARRGQFLERSVGECAELIAPNAELAQRTSKRLQISTS
jgi:hypothetical protein